MPRATVILACLVASTLCNSCGGGAGSTTASGDFRLIEFVEAGKDSVPRNQTLTFRFSAAVQDGQDFFERLKIENVQAGAGSNFSKAIGVYLPVGDTVDFVPKLPEDRDRGDAGLRANGEYFVFLKAGPDALTATTGDRIAAQQEFMFKTSGFFADPRPAEPPRATALLARDPTTDQTFDVGRADANPSVLSNIDNATLIAAGRVIEPGAGGAAGNFATPWQFDLLVSEPLDPATVTTRNVEMFEVFADATTSGETAPPAAPAGHFGTPVDFRVPVTVEAVQERRTDGSVYVAVRVVPLFTLVDDTRYRIRFSGNILGIDFRRSFIGENGLTGDGQTVDEVGGLGYTAEFIVRDRASIQSVRTVTYDPLVDDIRPETGQTQMDETRWNSALYDPASAPGEALGFLAAFGDGRDGNLAVASGASLTLDTGDTPNQDLGNPFTVIDPEPNDEYTNAGAPLPGPRAFDSVEPTVFQFANLTVGGTLRIVGVNPVRLRISGVVQVTGTIDVAGGAGEAGGPGGATRIGGGGGPGGFAGGDVEAGPTCNPIVGSCSSFKSFLDLCAAASSRYPLSEKGQGPGRGHQGGEAYPDDVFKNTPGGSGRITGTGGGGAGHATAGEDGEDRLNAGGAPGTAGPACASTWNVPNSGVIGVRGAGGATYGDRGVTRTLMGGSGGGGGGTHHIDTTTWTGSGSGGAGGGGGGHVEILAALSIDVTGAIDASGGAGGKGAVFQQASFTTADAASGAGGGGAGGSIVLVAGGSLNVTGVLDARGGSGGARAASSCNACNAGGDGGKGFIFLMDADGAIDGLLPGAPGEYDAFSMGVLTISTFDATRFGGIAAVTELFHALAADPDYLGLAPADVLATVTTGQRVRIFVSSARPDSREPLLPDLATEIAPFEVALVSLSGNAIDVSITGSTEDLNPDGAPARDSFLRVDARFEYDDGVQAAIGPFASVDQIGIPFRFNG